MNMRSWGKKLFVVFGLIALIFCGFSYALPAGGLPPAGPPQSAVDFSGKFADLGSAVGDGIGRVQQAFEQFETIAFNISTAPGITKLSQELVWVLGGISLTMAGLKMALGSEKGLEELVEGFLTVGFFALLQSPPVYKAAVTAFLSTTSQLQDAVLSQSTVTLAQASLLDAFKFVGTSVMKEIPTGLSIIWDSIIYLVVICIIGAIALFCTGYAILYIMLYTMLGKVLTAVAIVFGPIFIATGAWKVTKPMFDKWLNFIIIAQFYKLVGVAIIALLYTSSAIPPGNISSSIANCIFIAVMMLALAFVSREIPMIANSLLPGSLAVGSAPSLKTGPKNDKKDDNNGPPPPPTKP